MSTFYYAHQEGSAEVFAEPLRQAAWDHLPTPTRIKRVETLCRFTLVGPAGSLFVEYDPDGVVHDSNSLSVRSTEPFNVITPAEELLVSNFLEGKASTQAEIDALPPTPIWDRGRNAMQLWCSLDADSGIVHDFEVISGKLNRHDFVEYDSETQELLDNAETFEEALLAQLGLGKNKIESEILPQSLGQDVSLQDYIGKLCLMFERVA